MTRRLAFLLCLLPLPSLADDEPTLPVDDEPPAQEPSPDVPPADAPPADPPPADTPPADPPPADELVDWGEQSDWYGAEPLAPYAGGNVVRGIRIPSYGAGTGIEVGYMNVIGSNGGTRVGSFAARYGTERFGVQLTLPLASYRVPGSRDVGLGNLQLAGWYTLRDDSEGFLALGLELHGNLGDRAYTWAHDVREIWPGYGASVVVHARRAFGDITTLGRGAIGARTAAPYHPVVARHINLELAFALDYQLGDRVGVLGETTFSYWDLSPWDIALLGRVDLTEGLRLRAGTVLPVGVWVGFSPIAPEQQGLRELTLTADLSLSF
ncbi:MAG: hypothetical protein EA397_14180 [Deltaproteobacteria bacterium]|nr:MAG: hypothetical protein EA397_14180 [Deltaproteobacteria bacterium]